MLGCASRFGLSKNVWAMTTTWKGISDLQNRCAPPGRYLSSGQTRLENRWDIRKSGRWARILGVIIERSRSVFWVEMDSPEWVGMVSGRVWMWNWDFVNLHYSFFFLAPKISYFVGIGQKFPTFFLKKDYFLWWFSQNFLLFRGIMSGFPKKTSWFWKFPTF